MGLITSGRWYPLCGGQVLMKAPSQDWLWTSVTFVFPVFACLFWRRSRFASDKSITTDDWVNTNSICELLPRWRLHLSVLARWLPGYLCGSGGLDPTTGKPRSYWSYKADAFEQMAPQFTLAYIARWFSVEAWKGRLAACLNDSKPSQQEEKGVDDLRVTVENLLSAQSCSLGNSVRLPADGIQAYEWRRQLIQGAKKRLLFMTAYISVDDDSRAIAEDLADCARRGVDVYVALDNFGADAFVWAGTDTRYKREDEEQFEYADLIHLLREAGVKMCFWRAADCMRSPSAASGANGEYKLYDCKNHIKCIIADCEVAILTDRNVGSCYFRNPAYSCNEVVLTGPCVVELERQFTKLWAAGGGLKPLEPLADIEHTTDCISTLFASLSDSANDDIDRFFPDVWSAVMSSTPKTLESGVDPILLTLLHCVRTAKHSVDLMYAYMEICRPLQDELLAALRRGVAVRIVTNSRETNDLFWINGAFLQSVLPVVEAGGKLVMSICTPEAKGHVHAKLAVIDRRLLLVGSWNAWLRSILYEVEADVLIDSPPLATKTAQSIDKFEASAAYKTFDPAQIRAEAEADPLGVDPAVVGFL